MKFIADGTLGTLVKWLRLLGFDTLYHHQSADRALLTEARREGRVVLTRKRDIGRRQYSGTMLVLGPDRVDEQLRAVMKRFSLGRESFRFFSRCLLCNEELVKIERERIRGRVPPYTFETQEEFMICPACSRIYWSGTHRERAENWFKTHILKDRPGFFQLHGGEQEG